MFSRGNSLLDVASSGSSDGPIPLVSLGLLGVAANNAASAAYDTTALDAHDSVTGGSHLAADAVANRPHRLDRTITPARHDPHGC